MTTFSSAREAKEFLVARIVEEAQGEGVPLSEPERKMLYFSEGYWTLPDMYDVAAKFDAEYDQGEYEKKIARLVKAWSNRVRKDNPEEYKDWWAAVRALEKEDHYILVLIKQAGIKPPGDSWKLLGTGCLVSTVLIAVILLIPLIPERYTKLIGRFIPQHGDLGLYLWLAFLAVAVAYGLMYLIFGKKKASDTVTTILSIIFRVPKDQK